MTAYPNAYYTIPFYMLGQPGMRQKDIVGFLIQLKTDLKVQESLFGEYLFKNISDRGFDHTDKSKNSVYSLRIRDQAYRFDEYIYGFPLIMKIVKNLKYIINLLQFKHLIHTLSILMRI